MIITNLFKPHKIPLKTILKFYYQFTQLQLEVHVKIDFTDFESVFHRALLFFKQNTFYCIFDTINYLIHFLKLIHLVEFH